MAIASVQLVKVYRGQFRVHSKENPAILTDTIDADEYDRLSDVTIGQTEYNKKELYRISETGDQSVVLYHVDQPEPGETFSATPTGDFSAALHDPGAVAWVRRMSALAGSKLGGGGYGTVYQHREVPGAPGSRSVRP